MHRARATWICDSSGRLNIRVRDAADDVCVVPESRGVVRMRGDWPIGVMTCLHF